jgi:glyoxylase-like metal-dependent hydrolase (beta-lactamase superfamily II)
MDRLWGEVLPVPEDRIHTLSGGENVEGFRVAYTPGHASHHVSYLHEDEGDAYVGDVAGVRLPPFELTVAPTPPPDIDLEKWLESLATVAAWNADTLCLTHFGPVTEVEDHLHRIRTALLDSAEAVRDSQDEEVFVSWLRNRAAAEVDPDTAERLDQAAPPDQLFKGLERYWRKKAEADAA